jgi:NADH-quinone oxidoreductase subunit M
LAQTAPGLSIMLVIIALANIALPLTNAFVGEFMMFSGVYVSTATRFSTVFTVTAAITVILSAIYMLNMIQKVFYGNTNSVTIRAKDLASHEKIVLAVLVLLIVIVGVYPGPVLNLTRETVEVILNKMSYKF